MKPHLELKSEKGARNCFDAEHQERPLVGFGEPDYQLSQSCQKDG
jgi:hypothetical protein